MGRSEVAETETGRGQEQHWRREREREWRDNGDTMERGGELWDRDGGVYAREDEYGNEHQGRDGGENGSGKGGENGDENRDASGGERGCGNFRSGTRSVSEDARS